MTELKPPIRMVITLSEDTVKALPLVARSLDLPSDALSPSVVEAVLEILLSERALELSAAPFSGEVEAFQRLMERQVDDLLNPDVSAEITIVPNWNTSAVQRAEDAFEDLKKTYPGDQWIKAVEELQENQPLMKAALVAVYSGIDPRGVEPNLLWGLIERTYRLFQKSLDNPHANGQNAPANSAQSSQNGKEKE